MPDCEIWVRAVDNAGNASGWSRGRLAVSSISLTGTTVSVGKTATITTSISPSNASNKNLTWSSSNTSVATVNSSGVVTGVGAGTATITAASQDGRGASGSCSVTVKEREYIIKNGKAMVQFSILHSATVTEDVASSISGTNGNVYRIKTNMSRYGGGIVTYNTISLTEYKSLNIEYAVTYYGYKSGTSPVSIGCAITNGKADAGGTVYAKMVLHSKGDSLNIWKSQSVDISNLTVSKYIRVRQYNAGEGNDTNTQCTIEIKNLWFEK